MTDTITLLVGTTKGTFLARSDILRKDQTLSGPFYDGRGIAPMAGGATSGQIWATGGGTWWGAGGLAQ